MFVAYVVGEWSMYGCRSSNGQIPVYARSNQPMSLEPNSEIRLFTARSESAARKRSVWPTIQDVM